MPVRVARVSNVEWSLEEEFLRAHRKISVRLGCPHFGEIPQKQTQRGEFLCKGPPGEEVITEWGQQDKERKGEARM